MDPQTLVKVRTEAIGLDDRTAPSASETIRVASPKALTFATLPSDRPPTASERELPRISVELRGTLSTPGPEIAQPAPGDRDLEVLGTLGEGGMGRVFLARQHSLDRDVAIKTVRDSAADPERAALLAEGAITGYLEHPGVIPVHALGVDVEGRPVLVMKRVEGASWGDLLQDPEHPAFVAVWAHLRGDARERLDGHLEILMQVCNAVDFAHSRGILHRDIKPHNVLIGRYGEVYLADWGLALRVDSEPAVQPLCGTPAYMSPEMVIGGPLDARTDVYLLGATLHQILTGALRHVGTSVRATLWNALESAPVVYPPSVPEELAALANAATASKSDERPATAAAFRQAVADYRRHKSSIALARTAAERLLALRSLLESADDGLATETRQHDIDVRIAEVSFALEQATREWPENPVAVRSRTELDVLLAARHARAAELERMAREMDPHISYGQRAAAVTSLALVAVALSVHALLVDGRTITTRQLLYQSLGPLGAVTVLGLVLRRHLMRTALNRRALGGMCVLVATITTDRALGLVAGVSPSHVLLYDCLVAAAVASVGAVYIFRWIAWAAAFMLAAAVWAALSPDQAMSAFSLASAAGLALVVVLASKHGRRPSGA